MTVSISSMRKARSDCSVTLNLAVSPSTWLLQSDMVILNERIPRYNNTLLRVSENGMKFGVNHELNYDKSHAVQEKVHHPGGEHLDDLGDDKMAQSKQVVKKEGVPVKRPVNRVADDPVL